MSIPTLPMTISCRKDNALFGLIGSWRSSSSLGFFVNLLLELIRRLHLSIDSIEISQSIIKGNSTLHYFMIFWHSPLSVEALCYLIYCEWGGQMGERQCQHRALDTATVRCGERVWAIVQLLFKHKGIEADSKDVYDQTPLW